MENDVIKIIIAESEHERIEPLIIDGAEYYPASEVARMLGHRNPKKAIKDHCRGVRKILVTHPQSPNKTICKNFIGESDFYALIFDSRLPTAMKFRKWICGEVLPSIRKYGAYIRPELLTDVNFMLDLLNKLKAEREKQECANERLLQSAERYLLT